MQLGIEGPFGVGYHGPRCHAPKDPDLVFKSLVGKLRGHSGCLNFNFVVSKFVSLEFHFIEISFALAT